MELEKVIEEARQGNKNALELLYNAYRLKMRGVCIKILKDEREVVDDIVHDAFILAFTSLNKLKNPNKFGQWLTTIVTNITFKYLKQCNKVQIISLSETSDEELNIAEKNQDSFDEDIVPMDKLILAMDELPDGYRRIFKLSVIKGLSHKEIANLMGIEPHSSSSQLSRAKMMLRKLLSGYMALMLLVFVISVAIYRYIISKPSQERVKGDIAVKEAEHNDCVPIVRNKMISEKELGEIENKTGKNETMRPAFTYFDVAEIIENSAACIDEPYYYSDEESDTTELPEPMLDIRDIVEYKPKKRNWKMLLAGSLGPALAQNAYKLIVGNDGGGGGPVEPTTISTWEEYYDYLLSRSHDDMPVDSVALLNIAKNNSGDIVEKEKHEKAITLGLSLTKELNEKWSVETGAQYTLLRSTFTMGSGMNYVQKSQRLHYIGIPLKVSCRIADYRKLSAYGSVGVVMNIPVKGKVTQNLVTDTMTMKLDSRQVSPPLQWSVNASLGVQYELTRNMSIYLEPTLNYHIPTGSNIHSTWTERPFTFTMPVGIRFTW